MPLSLLWQHLVVIEPRRAWPSCSYLIFPLRCTHETRSWCLFFPPERPGHDFLNFRKEKGISERWCVLYRLTLSLSLCCCCCFNYHALHLLSLTRISDLCIQVFIKRSTHSSVMCWLCVVAVWLFNRWVSLPAATKATSHSTQSSPSPRQFQTTPQRSPLLPSGGWSGSFPEQQRGCAEIPSWGRDHGGWRRLPDTAGPSRPRPAAFRAPQGGPPRERDSVRRRGRTSGRGGTGGGQRPGPGDGAAEDEWGRGAAAAPAAPPAGHHRGQPGAGGQGGQVGGPSGAGLRAGCRWGRPGLAVRPVYRRAIGAAAAGPGSAPAASCVPDGGVRSSVWLSIYLCTGAV